MKSESPPNPRFRKFMNLMNKSLADSIRGKVYCSNCKKQLTPIDVHNLVHAYPFSELEPFVELMFLHTFYGICSKKCAAEYKEVHGDDIRKRDF